MTREQAIASAWGKIWDELGIPAQRKALSESGFVWDYHVQGKKNLPELEKVKRGIGFEYRPIKLSGIDDNNGWLDINSLEVDGDTLKEMFDRAPFDMWVCNWNGSRLPVLIRETDHVHINYTHYIKIEPPKTILYNE